MPKAAKIFSCLTILALAFFLNFHTSSALTSSPVRLELSGDPGSTVHTEFELYNEARKPQAFTIDFADFESQGEDGQPKFVKKTDGLSSWIQNETPEAVLGALERKDIGFDIHIPKDADPGGYFAGVFSIGSNPQTPESGEQPNISVQAEVGTLILLRVNGDFQEGADILEFNTKNKKHWFKSLPIDFYYRFQNQGDSWVKPLGDIVIENIFGQTSQIVPANPDGNNVLPKSIRKFEIQWFTSKGETQTKDSEVPPEMPHGFWNRVKHEAKYFSLGRYTANLTLNYGEKEPVQTKAHISFWVIPWELITTALAGLLILVVIVGSLSIWVALKFIKRIGANKK